MLYYGSDYEVGQRLVGILRLFITSNYPPANYCLVQAAILGACNSFTPSIYQGYGYYKRSEAIPYLVPVTSLIGSAS